MEPRDVPTSPRAARERGDQGKRSYLAAGLRRGQAGTGLSTVAPPRRSPGACPPRSKAKFWEARARVRDRLSIPGF